MTAQIVLSAGSFNYLKIVLLLYNSFVDFFIIYHYFMYADMFVFIEVEAEHISGIGMIQVKIISHDIGSAAFRQWKDINYKAMFQKFCLKLQVLRYYLLQSQIL